jgi:hypothetical protein
MKKLLIGSFCVFLAGCSTTVPVHMSFPQVPEDLRQACPRLKETDPNTTKLSNVLKDVTENYSKYNECKIKNDAWIQWYDTQKKIFEDIK